MGDQLYEDLDLIKPIFIFGGCKPSGADFYRRTGLFVLPCCLSSSRRNSSSINPRTWPSTRERVTGGKVGVLRGLPLVGGGLTGLVDAPGVGV